MKYFVILMGFFISCSFLGAQNGEVQIGDLHYKEDQFYIGVTYNLLAKKPNNVFQTGFSTGVHFGFIKDIPFNKKRNFGMGIGVGGSINSFNQNLLVDKNDEGFYKYSVLENFNLNRFYMNLIEVPLEFRWRTSTATSYKFWRIYSGIKLGYLLNSITKFEGQSNKIRHTQLDDFNKLQYGLSFSAGYNTWNFYVYYNLNPIFNNTANIDGVIIDAKALKIGLLFYIL